jgi:hypothetical protein
MEIYFPDDENGKCLKAMQERGDDLSIPRDVNFSFLFDNEEDARLFCAQATSGELRAKYKHVDDEFGVSWDVTVTRFMIPSHKDITRLEEELSELANSLGGQSDGWGCFSQK